MEHPSPIAFEPFRHGQALEQVPEPYDPEKPLVPDSEKPRSIRQQYDVTHHSKSRAAPNYVRITLRTVALALAISIMAMQAHSLYVWFSTRKDNSLTRTNGMTMKVWAVLDPWPTWITLGASVFAALVHIFALFSLCPFVSAFQSSKISYN